MNATPAQIAQYNRNAILSASPARLLTMLYDRLMLDLNRALAAQQAQQWNAASEQLLHAQDILTELQTTLRTDVWSGAPALLGLYAYVNTALVHANINRDPARTSEAISLLEPLRQAWHEASTATTQAPVVTGAAGVYSA
jgi:flagellar protein FliS